jgi:hypothetical protein
MDLSERDLAFLKNQHSAAMITAGADGVTILDGPDAPEQNLRLFREMQGRPTGPLQWVGGELTEDDFVRAMIDERRRIYDFEVHRAYGLH